MVQTQHRTTLMSMRSLRCVEVCHAMWLIDLNPDFPDDTRLLVALISAIVTMFEGISLMCDKKFMFAIGILQALMLLFTTVVIFISMSPHLNLSFEFDEGQDETEAVRVQFVRVVRP